MTVQDKAQRQIPAWWRPVIALATTTMILLLGWGVLFVWWQLRPVTLPTIDQPIPVLNPGHQIAPGESIILELKVSKPAPTDVSNATRWIGCDSGNLSTLTSNPTDLPAGEYTLISDSTVLPDKFVDGDVCTFHYRIDFRINPIRDETREYVSEPFTVVTDPQEAPDDPRS